MFSSLSLPFYTWRLALRDIKPRNSLFPLSIFDIMGHYPNVMIIWFLFLLKFCLDTNESSSLKSSQFIWIYFGVSSELVFSDIYRDLCPLSMYSFLSIYIMYIGKEIFNSSFTVLFFLLFWFCSLGTPFIYMLYLFCLSSLFVISSQILFLKNPWIISVLKMISVLLCFFHGSIFICVPI